MAHSRGSMQSLGRGPLFPLPPPMLRTRNNIQRSGLGTFPRNQQRRNSKLSLKPSKCYASARRECLAQARRFSDNGQIIQRFVGFRGYNGAPFPKHTLEGMSPGPPGVFEQPRGSCSGEDKYMLPGDERGPAPELPSFAQRIVDYSARNALME